MIRLRPARDWRDCGATAYVEHACQPQEIAKDAYVCLACERITMAPRGQEYVECPYCRRIFLGLPRWAWFAIGLAIVAEVVAIVVVCS
jgi:DNA-directed RNA polymerase subunit RPC12/RpoP